MIKERKVLEAFDDAETSYGMSKKYSVALFTQHMELDKIAYSGDDPKKAINAWVKNAKSHPTCACIDARTKKDAVELIATAVEMEIQLAQDFEKYKVPYKWDWFKEALENKLADKCRGFYESKYGDGDQVHPFDLG